MSAPGATRLVFLTLSQNLNNFSNQAVNGLVINLSIRKIHKSNDLTSWAELGQAQPMLELGTIFI